MSLGLNQLGGLLTELRGLIESARGRAAAAVNAELTLLYWRVGRRIGQEVLGGERAEYGKAVIDGLADQLTHDYGRSFEVKNLRRMVQFGQLFPDESIVATLSRQLSWSHLKELLPIEDPLQRDFYIGLARLEGWSVRQLRERVGSMLYERTALSRKPQLGQRARDSAAQPDGGAAALGRAVIAQGEQRQRGALARQQ